MRKKIESFALQQLDCVECKIHHCIVLLKDKILKIFINESFSSI